MELSNHSPALNLFQMLDLKQAVQSRQTQKIFYWEEWSKIPPLQCVSLINSYRKCLVEYFAAQGESSRINQGFIYLFYSACSLE